VQEAWDEVGIRVTGSAVVCRRLRQRSETANGDGYEELTRQIATLASRMKVLTRDVNSLKTRRKEKV
jgi:hypothetical protein